MFNKLVLGTSQAKYLVKKLDDKTAALLLVKFMVGINKFNIVKGSPADIATDWGVTIGDFSSGIRGLKKLDIVRKYTQKEYILNPDVMYQGDDRRYFVIKNMWDTQTSKGLKHG